MAQTSSLFKALEEEVGRITWSVLEDSLKAERDDPLAFVPDNLRLAAFRLLVHAELEDYLERKARENLRKLRASALSDPHPLRTFPEIYEIAAALDAPITLEVLLAKPQLRQWIEKLFRIADEVITANNGIKGPSFVRLAILGGKRLDEIDEALINAATAYGSGRGDVAHTSMRRVRTTAAPSVEERTAQSLLADLSNLFYGP